MNKYGKIAIVTVLALVVGAVLLAKQNRVKPTSQAARDPQAGSATEGSQASAAAPEETAGGSDSQGSGGASALPNEKKALPRLVDLGAGKCIPCKMMAPILEELRKEYAGRMEVVFIDVWENEAASDEYNVRTIPTQIFYDASGTERFRHEGFYSKKDILAKCEELGFDLGKERKDG